MNQLREEAKKRKRSKEKKNKMLKIGRYDEKTYGTVEGSNIVDDYLINNPNKTLDHKE